MPDKIYQRFDLDKRIESAASIEDLVGAGSTLTSKLLAKGYDVLMSSDSFCEIPKSIIVGGSIHQNIKGDFSEIAEEFGLLFNSGPAYLDVAQLQASKA